MIMKKLLIVFFIFQIFIDNKSYAENMNNISIIDSLVVSILIGQIDAIRSDNADSLAIDVSGLEDERSNYLKILIGNLAAEKSLKVFRNYNPISSFQGLVVTINRFTVDIEYSKPFEETFFGKNYITRRINAQLKGQIYSARTEEVKFVINNKTSYTDDIPYGVISYIENSSYEFTKGKREDYSFWAKIYEPVLVITSVAVVVYLFFAERS